MRSLIEISKKYKHYAYKVVFYENGTRAGYVSIPNNHPIRRIRNTYDVPLSCHWGLTWKGEGLFLYGYWIGFDCNHCDDGSDGDLVEKIWPDSLMLKHLDRYSGEARTKEYVESNCVSLIDQIVEKYKGVIVIKKGFFYWDKDGE